MFQLDKLFGVSKEKLLAQMGSGDNKSALEAVKKLQDKNHFRDGTLRGINLAGANLQKVLLARADMEGAVLQGANLRESYFGATNLRGANLEKADLGGANMREVILIGANLSCANMCNTHLASARLQEATLSGVNLCEANLWGANLQGATLDGAEFSSETVLPDGTRWTPDTDISRFTDQEHPNFWRSATRYSHAHK